MIKKYKQNGFTLLELLLVVSVFSVLLAGATVALDDWQKDTINRRVAAEMNELQNAAESYVRLNFEAIITPLTLDDVIEIPIADIIADGFLPTGYDSLNSFRQDLRVMARYVDDDSISGDVIEVIAFSESNPIENSRLFKSAREGGTKIGVISNLNISATCCNGLISSVHSTWSVPLTDYATLAPALPTPIADSGFLAGYGRISLQETILSDNYLLRAPDPGSADANTMETNLDINGNSILNANFIVSDNLELTGDLQINNTSGSGNALSVADNLTATSMNILSNGDNTKGNLTILGNGTIDPGSGDFNVGNLTILQDNAVGGGVVQAGTIIAQDTLSVLGNSNFNTLEMSGNNLTAENIYLSGDSISNSIRVNDTLQANSAQNVNNITVGNNFIAASTNVTNLNINSDVTIGSVIKFNSTTTGSNTINRVQSTNTAIIQNRSSCGAGC